MSKDCACSNERPCVCPNTDCENHGRCCACVEHHRDHMGNVPNCFKKKED